MRITFIAAIILAAFFITISCEEPQKTDDSYVEDFFKTDELLLGQYPSLDWPRSEYFKHALTLMTNNERAGYFKKEDDGKRIQYLRMLGVDVRVDMKYLIKYGMTIEDVKNWFTRHTNWEKQTFFIGKTEVLTGSRFNGRGYTNMYFNFVDRNLVSYGAYPNQIWEQEGEIRSECSRITTSLSKMISVGETMESIRNKFEYLAQQNAEILKILDESEVVKLARDRSNLTSTYWRSSMREYERNIIDSVLNTYTLLADIVEVRKDDPNSIALGYKLKFKEPTEIFRLQDLTYWHYDTPFGDRTIRYTIVFKDRKVKSWHADPKAKEY